MREFLRTWLGRHLAAIVAVKLAALVALWAAFFSAPMRADADAVARALVAPADATSKDKR
ncbi:MAG: cytochrome oxidase putative small subunit CydP [Burkholderiaceae bacterium]